MSICFKCKHFKQDGPLDFMVSGYCDWQSSVKLPEWLEEYVDIHDPDYREKRIVGKRYSGYEVKSCDVFELTDETTIAKRKSEEWYD